MSKPLFFQHYSLMHQSMHATLGHDICSLSDSEFNRAQDKKKVP